MVFLALSHAYQDPKLPLVPALRSRIAGEAGQPTSVQLRSKPCDSPYRDIEYLPELAGCVSG